MKLSIIVPVYNVQRYLDECVQSIVNQTFTDWECILVDDGSTDGSGAMCDEWAQKDSRIKVIHKENGGPSAAREEGIKKASGEFLAFVDSDDRLNSSMYEKMLNAQRESDYDYVICGLKRFFTENDNVRLEPAADIRIYGYDDIMNNLILPMIYPLEGEHFVSQSSTKNIYKRNIFSDFGIGYYDLAEIFSEDLLLNIDYLIHCHSAASIPDELYEYRANYDSFTNTLNVDVEKIQSIVNMYNAIASRLENVGTANYRLSIKCLELLSVCLRRIVSSRKLNDAYDMISYICTNADIRSIVSGCKGRLSLKNKIIKTLILNRNCLILIIAIKIYNIFYVKK